MLNRAKVSKLASFNSNAGAEYRAIVNLKCNGKLPLSAGFRIRVFGEIRGNQAPIVLNKPIAVFTLQAIFCSFNYISLTGARQARSHGNDDGCNRP
jgi:hypothetical protein